MIMTEKEFEESFTMVKNHIDDNAAFDGYMFETYGPELDYIRRFKLENPNKVWTIIDDNNGNIFYLSGLHLVDRVGFFITEEDYEGSIHVKFDE